MKKIIWGLLSIPVCIIIFNIIPIIFNFATYLIRIDNVDFGFPLWLDFLIDGVSGLIAYFFVRAMFSLSKKDEQTWQNIIAIVVGFIIGIIVHIFLKYWIVITIVLGIVLIVTIVCYIIKKGKQKKKSAKVKENQGENT